MLLRSKNNTDVVKSKDSIIPTNENKGLENENQSYSRPHTINNILKNKRMRKPR